MGDSLAELHIGEIVVWNGVQYEIDRIKPAFRDVTLKGKGGYERAVDMQDFFNAIATGEIDLPARKVESAASPKAWTASEAKEADFRLELVRFAEAVERTSCSDGEHKQRTTEICARYGRKVPSKKTIKRYRKLWQQAGYQALVPSFHRRGGSGWASKQSARELAARTLHETFMRNDRINLTTATMLVNERLRSEGDGVTAGQTINRKTVARILMTLPKDSVKAGRLDPRTYALWNRQAVRSYDVTRPFERIEIDAKTIDVYCRDEFGTLYSELTLYAMVCARTSYPVGIYVTGGKPSEYTLLKVLEFFFGPKDQAFKERFDISTQWVAPCGISTIVLDNASENASDLALSIVRRLGIQIEYARIARGDDKPHVESFFRTLDLRLFNLMPGAKNSQDKRLGKRHSRAQSEACLTVADIYKKVVQFVADVYIHEPCADLGFLHSQRMSIESAMARDLQTIVPFPPPSLAEVEQLLLSSNREIRKLQHYGVDFGGFQFHSYELSRIARETEIKTVELQYNPEDCTAIFVVDPLTNCLIRAENKMVGIPKVSFAVAKQLRNNHSKPDYMSGHDYQAAYAQLLDSLISRGSGKNKITQNNRELQNRVRSEKRDDIDRLLQTSGEAHPLSQPNIHNDDDDLEFTSSPRRKLK